MGRALSAFYASLPARMRGGLAFVAGRCDDAGELTDDDWRVALSQVRRADLFKFKNVGAESLAELDVAMGLLGWVYADGPPKGTWAKRLVTCPNCGWTGPRKAAARLHG